MMVQRSRVTVAVVVAFVSALAWACGDGPRPSSTGEAGNTPSAGGGGGVSPGALADAAAQDAALSDADSDGEASGPPPICSQVALEGEGIGESSIAGSPPTPTGGAIVAGTYRLTARSFYPDFADVGAMPNVDLVRRTLVFTATTVEIAEDAVDTDGGASGPRATTSSNFAINGPVLERTTTCPVAGAVKNVGFSVTGDDELVIFTSPERTETFTKQP